MKYKASVRYMTYCNVQVEADNESDAYEKAFRARMEENTNHRHEGFEVTDVELTDDNFTEDQHVFMSAFHTCIGDVPSDVVKQFVLLENDEDFKHREYYSSLADAHSLWEEARKHFTKETNETIS